MENYPHRLQINVSSTEFKNYLGKLVAGQGTPIAYIKNLSSRTNTIGVPGGMLSDVINVKNITPTVVDNIINIPVSVSSLVDTTLRQVALISGSNADNGTVEELLDIPDLEVRGGVLVDVSIQLIIQ